MSPTRSAIAARGGLAAALSTFVSLLSHISAGGAMPGAMGILAPLVLSTFVCVALAGRKVSLARLSLAVAGSQFLFHNLFVLGSPRGGDSTAGVMPNHIHQMTPGMAMPEIPADQLARADAGMMLAHVIAGVLTVAALYSAETVLSSIASLNRLILSRLLTGVPATRRIVISVPRVPLAADPELAVFSIGFYPSVSAHRGPPLVTQSH